MTYRSPDLLFRNKKENRLDRLDPGEFSAHQALPRFMVRWGAEAMPTYGVERIVNATVNACNRCVIGDSALCGQFCFAHAEKSGISSPRQFVPDSYAREHQRLEEMGYGASIFLSTDTEPLPGDRSKEATEITRITRQLLRTMVDHPPEGLILHTHTDVSADDETLAILKDVRDATNLIVGIGFETDTENLPNDLPPPCTSIVDRLSAIETLAKNGIKTQAAVAPLLGFRDFERFARRFPDIGAYRIMVGDLRLDFEVGGTSKAATLKQRLGLAAPSQEEAKAYFESLGFPPELVGYRDNFYVVLPEAA